MSPPSEDLIQVIEDLKGHSFIPENLESVVYHTISNLGGEAIRDCAEKDLNFKIGYIFGYRRRFKCE